MQCLNSFSYPVWLGKLYYSNDYYNYICFENNLLLDSENNKCVIDEECITCTRISGEY